MIAVKISHLASFHMRNRLSSAVKLIVRILTPDIARAATCIRTTKNAPAVHRGFLNGDFVVKESAHHFNQVPDDQALKHYNKPWKVAGGLIGITQKEPAMNRWSITYNERSKLAEEKHMLLGCKRLNEDSKFSHKECGVSRMKGEQNFVSPSFPYSITLIRSHRMFAGATSPVVR